MTCTGARVTITLGFLTIALGLYAISISNSALPILVAAVGEYFAKIHASAAFAT